MGIFKWYKHSDTSQLLSQKETPQSHSLSAAKETDASLLSLSERLQRVSLENIKHVTANDVKRIKETLTTADLESAIRHMLEDNRFVDVITYSSSAAWKEAARDIKPVQKQLIFGLIKERMGYLYNILPFVTENFLQQMTTLFGDKTNYEKAKNR
ncbi:unnamed protein product [Phytomonas sp. Hart1]|nr:unnamed protein product [Phytomonas sp. Hart1]|eukprot:CCW67525.1 unnamed protein product [Phytomonas sp. isolate Hart1]